MIFDGDEPANVKRGQTVQLRLKFSSSTDATIIQRGGFFRKPVGIGYILSVNLKNLRLKEISD
jgi:hypothetical protein